MTSVLKQKTINGLFWSFIDNISSHGITFIVGLILARLLEPSEFGLIGLITVFIAVSSTFINSGFSAALIRKKNCTDKDYSTVFYFNLAAGIFFYFLLLLSSPLISRFFAEPLLNPLIKVVGIVLIIDSLTIIQRTILTKRINFKLQTKISVISAIFSGIVGILMAIRGFGVWSLVGKQVCQQALNSFLLWLWNKWRPLLVFSMKSFKELFSFGYKLLLSGIIDTVYRNIYNLVIGKYFSTAELGFYTRANSFKNLPSQNLEGIIGRVSYPVLSEIQNDPVKLKLGYKKILKNTMYLSFILMAGMAAVAEPMIISLIGEKWRTSVIYLQMLCFVGALYPLHALNLNMLNVKGRSDLFLNLEIIKKILAIPTIIIGIIWGIKIMIFGMWINSLIAYYLNSYYSGRLINYPLKEQIKDILPGLIYALIMGAAVFLSGLFLPVNYLVKLMIQLVFGIVLVLGFGELFKFEPYIEIKEIVTTKVFRKNNGKQ